MHVLADGSLSRVLGRVTGASQRARTGSTPGCTLRFQRSRTSEPGWAQAHWVTPAYAQRSCCQYALEAYLLAVPPGRVLSVAKL